MIAFFQSSIFVNLAYIFASILFIFGLKMLSSPETAQRGNLVSASGMLIAILVTLAQNEIIAYEYLLVALIGGLLVGVLAASLVKMTSMPELVALFNGFGGIATSGWKGRSFSMGIADSVTVIAEKASVADAAATIIGNHIDLKNSNKVKKTIANNLYEDTDLNNKLITVSVENLTETEIRQAISKGKNISEHYISKNLIKSVIINLQDKILILGHKFNIKFNKKIKILEV